MGNIIFEKRLSLKLNTGEILQEVFEEDDPRSARFNDVVKQLRADNHFLSFDNEFINVAYIERIKIGEF